MLYNIYFCGTEGNMFQFKHPLREISSRCGFYINNLIMRIMNRMSPFLTMLIFFVFNTVLRNILLRDGLK